MGKTILYIWDADYPWDVRVEKICRSLISSGYDVHIASRNLNRNPTYSEDRKLHIHRMRLWKNDRLNYAFSFPAFFSPFWKQFIDSIIFQHAVDLVIVRDLPMAIAGILAGKRHGLPVIFDMAEDYVSMLRANWDSRKWKGLNMLVRNPYLAKFIERYVFKKSDYVLVVVEEAVEVVLQGGGVDEKISLVGNTPPLKVFESKVKNENLQTTLIANRSSYIYVGGLQMGRGIQTVLSAIPFIVQEIPDFLFVIVGEGYAKKIILDIIKNQKLEKYLLLVGWVDHGEIYNYIKAAKVGLIPHLATDHVNTTIPNKIFDYMGLGRPIITSDATPLKRIVEAEQCGLTFRSGDPLDLCKCVKEMSRTEIPFGQNGHRAVVEKYNWEKDKTNLLSTLDKVFENHKTKGFYK